MKTFSPNSAPVNRAVGNSIVAEIKSRLPLRDVAALIGAELPTRDGVKFRSPLRSDRNPSCTIKADVLFDWSTGEHFDAIDLYAAAKNITNTEAIRELGERLHLGSSGPAHVSPIGDKPKAAPAKAAPPSEPIAFDESEPRPGDLESILAARSWPVDALDGLLLAYELRVLRVGRVCGCDSWIVTDEARRIAEARRIDGKAFAAVGNLGERKAHTVRGSVKSWPAGLRPRIAPDRLPDVPLVLVEGGPDLLAAYAVLARLSMNARDVHPVALLGTSASIAPDALTAMAGRVVVILAHGDDPGREASRRWAKQLSGAGCRVTLRNLPDGKDLADLLTEHAAADLAGLITPPQS
jgi:hypothetical protein